MISYSHKKILTIPDAAMSTKVEQVIEPVKELSADERAFVAHCLISSLDERHDDGVEQAWLALAENVSPSLLPVRSRPLVGTR